MKQGYFISQDDFVLLATLAEVLQESTTERLNGEILNAVLEHVSREPTEIEDSEEIAKRDAYWDKVCEQHDRDILANHPPMEGWDVVWAQVDKRLRGES